MRPGMIGTRALLITLAACAGPPPEPADPSSVEFTDGEVGARATSAGLELTNSTDAPVYYRARDPLTLALSDRIPCLEPANCPSVPARSRITVPFEEAIVGYRAETERALVYWWHFVQQPDGSVQADRVRTFEIVFEGR
jgi:hypothetical protein